MCISFLRGRDRVLLLNYGAVQTEDLFRILRLVDSLNVKHELRFTSKTILHHSGRYFFFRQFKIVLCLLHDGVDGSIIQTSLLGVCDLRGQLKLRLCNIYIVGMQ